jgi:hypothetical protein
MDVINLYKNWFLLIFKIYFHNIRGTPFENHCPMVIVLLIVTIFTAFQLLL